MSDIVRVKVHSRKKHRSRLKRGKSLAPTSKKFAAHFPTLYRAGKRMQSFFKKHRFIQILFYLNLAGLLLAVCSLLFSSFATGYSKSVGHGVRSVLGILPAFFPISIGEVFVVLALLFLPVWIVTLILALKRKYTLHHIRRKMRTVLWMPIVCSMLVLALFLFTMFPAYHATPLAERLGIDEAQIYEDDLCDTLDHLVETINLNLSDVAFDENGASIQPYSFTEMSKSLNNAFYTIEGYQLCPSSGTSAKQLLSSPLLAKFSLTGVYTFFSGEANVNTAYPDFLIPHTAAHELAHARGIASENNADFIAYLACANSQNAYDRYSGNLCALLSIRSEVQTALQNMEDGEFKTALTARINQILGKLDPRVQGELNAYSDFLSNTYNETLAEITDNLNDTYLKAQGQSAGSDSYQYLSGLMVNFYATYLA